jgi:hypothetical protein
MLYSFQGAEPTELPNRIKFPGGRTHYLSEGELSTEELAEAGWTGPFTPPPFELGAEKLQWDSELESYRVIELSEEERASLWLQKGLENNEVIKELRAVAVARKGQLEALGLSTAAVDQFVAYLNAIGLDNQNPFYLRLPSLTLLGIVPGVRALNDPFHEWLKQHFESDLSHGYHVEGEDLQIRDEGLFEAHKVAVMPEFLSATLEAQYSCVAFFSRVEDHFNATGDVLINAYGSYDELVVTDNGVELTVEHDQVRLNGTGRHELELKATKAGQLCSNKDVLTVELI